MFALLSFQSKKYCRCLMCSHLWDVFQMVLIFRFARTFLKFPHHECFPLTFAWYLPFKIAWCSDFLQIIWDDNYLQSTWYLMNPYDTLSFSHLFSLVHLHPFRWRSFGILGCRDAGDLCVSLAPQTPWAVCGGWGKWYPLGNSHIPPGEVGKSSSKVPFLRDILVPERVDFFVSTKQNNSTSYRFSEIT